jgi:muconolactone delta-isomerase
MRVGGRKRDAYRAQRKKTNVLAMQANKSGRTRRHGGSDKRVSKSHDHDAIYSTCKNHGTLHSTLVHLPPTFYKSSSIAPLSDDELEKHEETVDQYDQMQAAVREIIYRTVDKTTFLQVKGEVDAASVWKKVASIHADKGSLYEANLLVQLQNARYVEKESMREHIGKMTELRERLAEMNAPISDESFVSYL